MAKVVGGMADNLLTSVVRAWDASGLVEQSASGGERRRKRILVAPAMNTAVSNLLDLWLGQCLKTLSISKVGAYIL